MKLKGIGGGAPQREERAVIGGGAPQREERAV